MVIFFMTTHIKHIISSKTRINIIQCLSSCNMGDSQCYKKLQIITSIENTVPLFNTRLTFYRSSLFPSATIEWNHLDQELRNCEDYSLFHFNSLKFIRPFPSNFFNCQNIIGMKFVTRLHLGLSHLEEHKSKHSFQDTVNPLCNCGLNVESCIHFLS